MRRPAGRLRRRGADESADVRRGRIYRWMKKERSTEREEGKRKPLAVKMANEMMQKWLHM